MSLSRSQLISDLHELIEALDRRVPRMERAGEAAIVRDAAALRTEAVKRLAQLEDPDLDVPSPPQGIARCK
jgi:hypothetical protein